MAAEVLTTKAVLVALVVIVVVLVTIEVTNIL